MFCIYYILLFDFTARSWRFQQLQNLAACCRLASSRRHHGGAWRRHISCASACSLSCYGLWTHSANRVQSLALIILQFKKQTSSSASWWSYTEQSKNWSLQSTNKTKLTPLLGILLTISFCLLRQPIIFHAALPEARTTSCWDGFFEFPWPADPSIRWKLQQIKGAFSPICAYPCSSAGWRHLLKFVCKN